MDRRLIRDLERWERGELPLETLEVSHGARAAALAELHGRLGALGAGPVPAADVAWAELAARLPARGFVVPIVRRFPRGLVVAAAAAAVALVLGVAAPTPVRHDLLSFFDRVRTALGLEGAGPGMPVGPVAPTPSGSPVVGTGLPAPPEDGAEAAEHGSGEADDEAGEAETSRGDEEGDADDEEGPADAQGHEDQDADEDTGRDTNRDAAEDANQDTDRDADREGDQDTGRGTPNLDQDGNEDGGGQGDG